AITVDDHKISGSSGCFEGTTLVHEGTLLLDFSPEEMMAVLRLPKSPRVTDLKTLVAHPLSITDLQREIGVSISNHFGFLIMPGELSTRERRLADKLHAAELGTDAFVFGQEVGPGQISSAADRVPA